MLLISRFRQKGPWLQIGSLALVLATMLTWVAFTTTGWGGYPREPGLSGKSGTHFGLWRKCSDSRYSASCSPLDGWALEWFIAFQAFVTLGFVGVNVTLLLLVLYIYHIRCQGDVEFERTAGISCFVSGALYLVGVVDFAINYRSDYIEEEPGSNFKFGYCFAMSVVAILLLGVAGIFILLDTRQPPSQPLLATPATIMIHPTAGLSAVHTTADPLIVKPVWNQQSGSSANKQLSDDAAPIIEHTEQKTGKS